MISFNSALRRKLLAFYFTNPTTSLYLRDLAARLHLDPANLSRELGRLERQGVFISDRRGNQKYYRLNTKYPLHKEIERIVFKTIGVVGQLKKALPQVAGINQAYLYGSFARNQQDANSDIDLLLVGDVKMMELEPVIRNLEKQFGREINYTVISSRELKKKRAQKDPFFETLWRGKKIPLMIHP
jgi:predicted nucleotidyltransferase